MIGRGSNPRPSANDLTLRFISDCRRFYGSGTVSTPNFPSLYDNNEEECYVITSSPGMVSQSCNS